MKCFLKIYIYGRGWFGLAGSLQLFLWIRTQWPTVQGQSQSTVCWQDFWCLQWCQWETRLDCSMADLCFISYLPKKAVVCSWPPEGKSCWSCPMLGAWFFRPLGLPVRWDRPAHLVCLSSALPKGCSSGCGFQIIFSQDPMAPRCFCEDLLCQLYYIRFSSFPYPIPEMDVSALEQWVGLFIPTELLLLLAQWGSKWIDSSSRQISNQALLNLQQLR